MLPLFSDSVGVAGRELPGDEKQCHKLGIVKKTFNSVHFSLVYKATLHILHSTE